MKEKFVQLFSHTQDERISYATSHFERWQSGMSTTEKNIITDMLIQYDYYSKFFVNNYLADIWQDAQLKIGDGMDYTLLTVINSQHDKINSSFDMMSEIKLIGDISSENFAMFFEYFDYSEYEHVKNIILIDDFTGSGNTIIDFLTRNIEKLKGKTIFLYLIHALKKGVNKLSEFAVEHDLNLTISCWKVTDHYYEQLNDPVGQINVLNQIFSARNLESKFITGYEDSGALLSFYKNTPNNTFSIFWENNEKNHAIFPRKEDTVPKWKQHKSSHTINHKDMKEQRKKRQEENYYDARNQKKQSSKISDL